MPLWQRFLITLAAMLLVSLVAGLVWAAITGYDLPSYVGGLVGGLTALPVWEFLKRVRPAAERAHQPGTGGRA